MRDAYLYLPGLFGAFIKVGDKILRGLFLRPNRNICILRTFREHVRLMCELVTEKCMFGAVSLVGGRRDRVVRGLF